MYADNVVQAWIEFISQDLRLCSKFIFHEHNALVRKHRSGFGCCDLARVQTRISEET